MLHCADRKVRLCQAVCLPVANFSENNSLMQCLALPTISTVQVLFVCTGPFIMMIIRCVAPIPEWWRAMVMNACWKLCWWGLLRGHFTCRWTTQFRTENKSTGNAIRYTGNIYLHSLSKLKKYSFKVFGIFGLLSSVHRGKACVIFTHYFETDTQTLFQLC